ncbi:MAG TPA: hypothetical protein VN174_01170, partial [Candidatus Methanoperedens sp.]|nr:hypothetical protein [Candidatus Methanoperedens sp.]
DYNTVREEIGKYSSTLKNKQEIIILTKSDILEEKNVKKLQKELGAKLSISIINPESIKKLNDLLTKEIQVNSGQYF